MKDTKMLLEFKNKKARLDFVSRTAKVNKTLAKIIDTGDCWLYFEKPAWASISGELTGGEVYKNGKLFSVPGHVSVIYENEIKFFKKNPPIKIFLEIGDKVEIISGKYKGEVGFVKKIVNSARDGVIYYIDRDNGSGVPDLIQKVAHKVAFLNQDEVNSTVSAELKTAIEKYERQAVVFSKTKNIVEYGFNDNDENSNVFRDDFTYMHGLCTLVYEEDGQILANVVFKGSYVVIPVTDISETNSTLATV